MSGSATIEKPSGRVTVFVTVFFPDFTLYVAFAVARTTNARSSPVAADAALNDEALNVQFVPDSLTEPVILPAAVTFIAAEADSPASSVAVPVNFPRVHTGSAAIAIGSFTDTYLAELALLVTVNTVLNVPLFVGTPVIAPLVALSERPVGRFFAENFTG